MESELLVQDMVSVPPISENIVNYATEKLNSQTVLPRSDQSPVSFYIEGRDDSFIDVKNIQMHLKVKIRKIDPATNTGVDLPAAELVAPYNAFFYTFWEDVRVELQHRPVDKTFDFYQQQVYLQLLLYSPITAKNSYLKNALWYPDEAGGFDIVARNVAVNAGEYSRSVTISQSRSFQMQGRVFVDLFNISRPMVENVSISLHFIPHKPIRCLVSAVAGASYEITIEDCYLLVPRLKMKPSLLNQPAVYPWTKMEISKFVHPQGVRNFNFRTVYIGHYIPKRCLVFLMSETRFDGRYDRNRLNLEHFSVDNMLVTVNDEHKPYHNGFESDFANSNYAGLYAGIFSELNKEWDPDSLFITPTQFRGGYTFWPFDLTSNKSASANFYSSPRGGSVHLQIHFSIAPANNVVVLVALEHERVLFIDKERNWIDKEAFSENGP